MTNVDKRPLECYLCRLLLKETGTDVGGPPAVGKSIYGCTKCGKGFHVDCYSAFHFRSAMQKNPTVLNNVVSALEREQHVRDKVSAKINKIEDLTLFCQGVLEEHASN